MDKELDTKDDMNGEKEKIKVNEELVDENIKLIKLDGEVSFLSFPFEGILKCDGCKREIPRIIHHKDGLRKAVKYAEHHNVLEERVFCDGVLRFTKIYKIYGDKKSDQNLLKHIRTDNDEVYIKIEEKDIKNDDITEQNFSYEDIINKNNVFRVGSDPYVRIELEDHKEIHCIDDEFKKLFHSLIWKKGKPSDFNVPSEYNKSEAESYLENMRQEAIHNSPDYVLWNRVASKDGNLYYDLTDHKWRAVKISPDGWEILNEPPILFYNHRFHQLAQAEPVQVNIENATEFLWSLFKTLDNPTGPILLSNHSDAFVYMIDLITKFLPNIDIPLRHTQAPAGTQKTFVDEMTKHLVDPSKNPYFMAPETAGKDEIVNSFHHWMPIFDNCNSVLPKRVQTFFSMLCTGFSDSGRMYYTNYKGIGLSKYKRPICTNGIINPFTQPDLLDRVLVFELDTSSGFAVSKDDLEKEFKSNLPNILGSIFTILSYAMKIKPGINIKTRSRFVDYLNWGYSIGEIIGKYSKKREIMVDGRIFDLNNEGGSIFQQAYTHTTNTMFIEQSQNDPVVKVILDIMSSEKYKNGWGGSAGDLLKLSKSIIKGESGQGVINDEKESERVFNEHYTKKDMENFPENEDILGRKLVELTPVLRRFGISITKSKTPNKVKKEGKWVSVKLIKINKIDDVP